MKSEVFRYDQTEGTWLLIPAVPLEKDAFEPADILCENASGLSVHLPSSIDDQLAKEIRNIGLRQARNVEVWPAGLAALNWDGEGRGEWLASENPRIGIKGDHQNLVAATKTAVERDLSSTSR